MWRHKEAPPNEQGSWHLLVSLIRHLEAFCLHFHLLAPILLWLGQRALCASECDLLSLSCYHGTLLLHHFYARLNNWFIIWNIQIAFTSAIVPLSVVIHTYKAQLKSDCGLAVLDYCTHPCDW